MSSTNTNPNANQNPNPINYILVDTSYWIFYRYYAIYRWWTHAKSEDPLPENPADNPEFVEKFKKTFIESIELFKKKQKIHKTPCKIIAARDCPRHEIWRNSIYPQYKETRGKDDAFMGGEFFKCVYANNNEMLYKTGVNHVLKFPTLEADDIVAISKNWIRQKYPDAQIYILANDHDYLQLLDDKCEIINFQMKNLRESKKVLATGEQNLFYKIILGDKSDNIKSVFKKCGPKTTEKYYNDPTELEKALNSEEGARINYERNKKLVSFAEIPQELTDSFIELNRDILASL